MTNTTNQPTPLNQHDRRAVMSFKESAQRIVIGVAYSIAGPVVIAGLLGGLS